MPSYFLPSKATKTKKITKRALDLAERFMHIESTSGLILLFFSLGALFLANSSYADFYRNLWHIVMGINCGPYTLSWDLHFWVNDILMTLFFLVVGMEIKQEITEGTLSDIRQALLPIFAAIGGVLCPALIYFFFNKNHPTLHGWAIPTATDIAFAMGILALLGKAISHNVRIILLSLAIIDDIIAVIIITLFYSQNIDLSGLYFIAAALSLVFLFQAMGLNFAPIYCIPGIILWFGFDKTGIHPSLAGVVLGLLTPAKPVEGFAHSLKILTDIGQKLSQTNIKEKKQEEEIKANALKDMRHAGLLILAPTQRVQKALHSWVAYLIMPIFAFANAGVSFSSFDLKDPAIVYIICGIFFGLVIGKPFGIFITSFIIVKLKICKLPHDVGWSHIALIGILAGIGFTMAIFVALLAFNKEEFINIGKISVLIASMISAVFGLLFGLILRQKQKK